MDKSPILLLFGLLAASTVLAQAYRWVDEDGVVHFGDRPPPDAGTQAEAIVLPKANVTTVRTYESSFEDREFLRAGDVFSDNLIDAYIDLKLENVTRLRMTTHPVEFDMYYSL